MKNLISILFFAVLIVMTAGSCKKNSDGPPGLYEGGLFISNEGTYLNINGTVSCYYPDNDTVVNRIFYNKNGRYAGDLVYSVSVFKNRAYICSRGSGKIEITDLNFNSIDSVVGVTGVRYFVAANENKGYTTSWDQNGITIINLNSKTASGAIITGRTHEKMLLDSNRVFFANSGGNGADSTISVVDINSDIVIKTINLPAYKPMDMLKDLSGNLWVLCQGKEVKHGGPTPAMLIKINMQTYEITASAQLFDNQYPAHLAISPDGQTVYYGGGLQFIGIYGINTNTLEVPVIPLVNKQFYSLAVNPFTGNILAIQSTGYTTEGKLFEYSIDGSYIKDMKVGIAPVNIN